MTDSKSGARTRDDADLQDSVDTPAQGGRAGGGIAADVGTRDEARNAMGGDPEPTRVTKQDKTQPATGTRSDHEGAQR